MGVSVDVAVRVDVSVRVGVDVGVDVSVGVGVDIGVGVFVPVSVATLVGLAVDVTVAVAVPVVVVAPDETDVAVSSNTALVVSCAFGSSVRLAQPADKTSTIAITATAVRRIDFVGMGRTHCPA